MNDDEPLSEKILSLLNLSLPRFWGVFFTRSVLLVVQAAAATAASQAEAKDESERRNGISLELKATTHISCKHTLSHVKAKSKSACCQEQENRGEEGEEEEIKITRNK